MIFKSRSKYDKFKGKKVKVIWLDSMITHNWMNQQEIVKWSSDDCPCETVGTFLFSGEKWVVLAGMKNPFGGYNQISKILISCIKEVVLLKEE